MTTYKQKLVAQKIHENPRISIRQAMLRSGYSKHTANHPSDLIESKGWHELIDDLIPNKSVASAHRDLLSAYKMASFSFPLSETDYVIIEIIQSLPGNKVIEIRKNKTTKTAYYWIPDNRMRATAIDMAYKLRGLYKAEKMVIEDPFENMTNDELEEQRKELLASQKRYYESIKKPLTT